MKKEALVGFIIVIILVIPNHSFQAPDSIVTRSETTLPVTNLIYGQDISSEIFDEVSLNNYQSLIRKLTENGSRWTTYQPSFSDANIKAREWITDYLETVSEGKIDVTIFGNYRSVIGKLPGYIGDNAPILMVGGHYDSVRNAPGANDDASGVATVLELARVMSSYHWPLDIYFCAWNSEELGLLGSGEYAEYLRIRNVDILAYYNVDMLLVADPEAENDEKIWTVHNAATIRYAELTRAMSCNHGHDYITPLSSSAFGNGWKRSDQWSFINEGYENVMYMAESGWGIDTAYHQPTDTWDNELYNYNIAAEGVAAIGASMALTMARQQGLPVKSEVEGIIYPDMEKKLYIPSTTNSLLKVKLSWEGGPIEATLYSPSSEVLDSYHSDEEIGDDVSILFTETEMSGLFRLKFSSSSSERINFTSLMFYETDFDRNGIKDSEEFWVDPSLFLEDSDEDGLSDGLERIIGTFSNSSDSDNDALPDLWEYQYGTNPTEDDSSQDYDFDRLSNSEEFEYGTHPLVRDSDSDGIPDGWESLNQTDPLVSDENDDPDMDGISNLNEYRNGTYPFTNDTDEDMIDDLSEILLGLNPRVNDSLLDFDNDTLSNYEEYKLGTNIFNADSDGDQLPDDWEVLYGTDPLVNDSLDDLDGDGYSNYLEYELGLHPGIPSYHPVFVGSIGILIAVSITIFFLEIKRKRNPYQ